MFSLSLICIYIPRLIYLYVSSQGITLTKQHLPVWIDSRIFSCSLFIDWLYFVFIINWPPLYLCIFMRNPTYCTSVVISLHTNVCRLSSDRHFEESFAVKGDLKNSIYEYVGYYLFIYWLVLWKDVSVAKTQTFWNCENNCILCQTWGWGDFGLR